MVNLRGLFIPQLLFAFFTTCLCEITSADVRYVHPGETITLPCNITDYPLISWYQLRSDEVKLLISAELLGIDKIFSLSYTVNESHFGIKESSSLATLVIIGVRETDVGFYYCEGRNRIHKQFEKLIRLNFADISPAPKNHSCNSAKHQDTLRSTGLEFWIAVCVCSVSILINLSFVFCCIFKGKSLTSCRFSSNPTDSKQKEENIQYASVQYKRRSRATAKKNTALESDKVIYAAVTPKTN
ncbi:uncharacterized protein LOC128513130 [Clarias gariepinus]|uniref:uncharacterized protein LOC128513130 n=1 Tax=Clarias gariepinus TaxID=13013 RepID=UPI00234C704A|nr:uncharacterized protein LOC128513130 [Clarias gariepinus]